MAQRPGRPRKSRDRVPAAAAAPPDRFAALADGTRRHLLEQLAVRDRAVGELVTGLDISQAASASLEVSAVQTRSTGCG